MKIFGKSVQFMSYMSYKEPPNSFMMATKLSPFPH